MAARGTIAKEEVVKIIQKAFGENFIGEVDKKLYVQAKENGEMVQIAISMTCPKTPVAAPAKPLEWGLEATPIVKTEIPQEEIDFAKNLLKNLGIED